MFGNFHLGYLNLHGLSAGSLGPERLHVHLLGLRLQHRLVYDHRLHNLQENTDLGQIYEIQSLEKRVENGCT
ncbi:MAG: hypothetical protein ACK56I_21895, partial [bacterium]